jgi:hypothetical protein
MADENNRELDARGPEKRLLDSVAADERLDLAHGATVGRSQMTQWGPERTIQATVLHSLLTNDGQASTRPAMRWTL